MCVADFKGMNLLAVDDNIVNLEITKAIFEARNAKVDTEQIGDNAIEKLKMSAENYYSAVLVDLEMPYKDGFEIIKEIRELERADLKNIKIIIMSADDVFVDHNKIEQSGADGFLAKPVEAETVYNILNQKQ
ncbi:MAG: response regulator [Clostridiales bacterium]|nr:response regulator [Clostridiales bacterium]